MGFILGQWGRCSFLTVPCEGWVVVTLAHEYFGG